MKRMLWRNERLLAMKDRGIGAGAVIVTADLAGDEIDDDCFRQSGVWMEFKVRIGEKRDLRRGGVEFQQIELRADVHAPTQLGHRDAEQ